MKGLQMGLGLVRRGGSTFSLPALVNEATVLGDTFARAGNQWNPITQAFIGANLKVQQNITLGGRTIALTLVERGGTNIASSVATGTYAIPTTSPAHVWWDGAAGDYTLTTSGAGTFSAKLVTADGRNYQTLTGHAAADTVTCTRAGSPTNTHLQVENADNPTSKMALSGTRTQVQWRTTNAFTGIGTIVMLFQPYGWSQQVGPSYTGAHWFRQAGGSAIYLVTTAGPGSKQQIRFAKAYSGGTGTRDQPWAPKDGVNRLVACSWSTDDIASVRVSGRQTGGTDGFTDGVTSAPGGESTGHTSTDWNWLDIGSWYSGAAQSQCNGWIALLHYTRVLNQNEVDQIAIAFEGATGFAPEINAWGDSLTAYSSGNTYPDQLIVNYRPTWRGWNGGVGGETIAQIYARFLAHSRKWRGFTFLEGQNSQDLATMQAMVALLGHQRYIVLGQLNDATSAQSGSANYNNIIAYNLTLATAFGANYFDWRAYLITKNVSPGDDVDTGHDCIGTSQRGDSLHLNSTGQANAAAKFDLLMTAMGVTYP